MVGGCVTHPRSHSMTGTNGAWHLSIPILSPQLWLLKPSRSSEPERRANEGVLLSVKLVGSGWCVGAPK